MGAIATQSRMVRLPLHIHQLYSKVKKCKNSMKEKLEREPLDEEIAKEMKMPLHRLQRVIDALRPLISLDEPLYKSSFSTNDYEYEDIITDPFDCPDIIKRESQSHSQLISALCELGAEERQIVRMRYGLDDGKVKTTREIAEYAKITIEYARRLEQRALQKLRSAPVHKMLKDEVQIPLGRLNHRNKKPN